MSNTYYKIAKNGRWSYDQHKQYEGFYTYFSKRGHYVACDLQGESQGFKTVEGEGETEYEAIINLKHKIIKRMDDMKVYFDKKNAETETILNSVKEALK